MHEVAEGQLALPEHERAAAALRPVALSDASYIVAGEAGAVVKTIGDAVMATFPTPERAVAAALRMREAMRHLNEERGREDLLLKIGIHAGPCLAEIGRAHV